MQKSMNSTNAQDGFKILEFAQRGDERGHLVVIEGDQDVPFAIKRIFYIYGSDTNVVRGQHANLHTQFVLINIAGSSKIQIKDGKGNETIVSLQRPHTGVYIPQMIWKDMYDFSTDSILLVIASEIFDPKEYIRDYDEYVKLVNQ